VTLRPATTADAPAVVALVNSAYRGESSRAGWTTEADLLDGQRVDLEGLVTLITTPDHVVLLSEDHDGPVGCVHLQGRTDICRLGMLTIRPTAQRGGLGRKLLRAAERWAVAQWASRSIEMTVIAQREPLIAWYERRGYRRTGERRPFPYGNPRFGVPRRDDLVFDVLRKALIE